MRGRTSALAALAIILAASWLLPSAQPQEAQAASASFSGHGTMTTNLFFLNAGLLIISANHNGDGSFDVDLRDSSGQHADSLLLESGAVNVQASTNISTAGNYLLNITANGDWSITLAQPRPTSAPLPPLTYTGTITNITPFVRLYAGLVTFRLALNNPNGRLLIASLRDVSGNYVDTVFDTSATSFNGSHASSIRTDGIHFLDVYAHGNWSITVEQTTGGVQATATFTPTITPTPTPTPTPLAVCSPRPPVRVATTRSGAGQLQATIVVAGNPGATSNAVQALTFGAIRNASVQIAGVGPAQSGQSIPIPGRPQSVTLTMTRVGAGAEIFVPLTVTDACGDWKTFVGVGSGG